MVGLTFQKKLILVKKMHEKSVILVIIGIFLDKGFKYEPYLCNVCHKLMQETIKFNDVAIELIFVI